MCKMTLIPSLDSFTFISYHFRIYKDSFFTLLTPVLLPFLHLFFFLFFSREVVKSHIMDEWVWVHDGSGGRTKPEKEEEEDIDDMESEGGVSSNDGELGRSGGVAVVLALFVGAIIMIVKSLM